MRQAYEVEVDEGEVELAGVEVNCEEGSEVA